MFVHSVAHDELGAAVELVDEARNVGEVVRQVGVRHDDVVASRRVEAGEIGTAVASTALVDDPCPCTLGELWASVRRAVVGDDDLAVEAVSVQHGPRLGHAALDRSRFVQARNDDRNEGPTVYPIGKLRGLLGTLFEGFSRSRHPGSHDAEIVLVLC